MLPVAQNLSAHDKAKLNNEPVFTLRASDISAPLVIAFWVMVQQHMTMLMDAGATMEEALTAVRVSHNIPSPYICDQHTPKQSSAMAIAIAMRDFPQRKMAD